MTTTEATEATETRPPVLDLALYMKARDAMSSIKSEQETDFDEAMHAGSAPSYHQNGYYNWSCALAYLGTVAGVAGDTTKYDPILEEDIAHVFDSYPGANNGPAWMIAGVLKDGRYFYLEASCDYTGWDCQAGGTTTVARDLRALYHFGLTDEARERLPGVIAALESGHWP